MMSFTTVKETFAGTLSFYLLKGKHGISLGWEIVIRICSEVKEKSSFVQYSPAMHLFQTDASTHKQSKTKHCFWELFSGRKLVFLALLQKTATLETEANVSK